MLKVIFLATLTLSSFSYAAETQAPQEIEILVTDKGFEPSSVAVAPGVPVTLKITRKTETTCATRIQIPAKKMAKDLPLDKPVYLKLGKLKKGEIKFGCGMNMMIGGVIQVK